MPKNLRLQVKAARVLLEWHQTELAERAGVAPQTISGLEADTRTTSRAALKLIRAAIEDGGVELFDAVKGVHGAGVRWKWRDDMAEAPAGELGEEMEAGDKEG